MSAEEMMSKVEMECYTLNSECTEPKEYILGGPKTKQRLKINEADMEKENKDLLDTTESATDYVKGLLNHTVSLVKDSLKDEIEKMRLDADNRLKDSEYKEGFFLACDNIKNLIDRCYLGNVRDQE
jgi:hypothetical protein